MNSMHLLGVFCWLLAVWSGRSVVDSLLDIPHTVAHFQ